MQQIHKVLWPIYLYVFFLLFFYSGPVQDVPVPLLIILFCGIPLALWVSIVALVHKNIRHAKRWHYFAYCSIPGIIFGYQISYGFYAAGHGENPIGAILPLTFIALLVGAFSGFMGSMTREATNN